MLIYNKATKDISVSNLSKRKNKKHFDAGVIVGHIINFTLHIYINLTIRFVQNLFVYLFVLGLLSHSRIFHSFGDVIITGEGLQILTFARHSRSLSNEGSLALHTYCDREHPIITVKSEDP